MQSRYASAATGSPNSFAAVAAPLAHFHWIAALALALSSLIETDDLSATVEVRQSSRGCGEQSSDVSTSQASPTLSRSPSVCAGLASSGQLSIASGTPS